MLINVYKVAELMFTEFKDEADRRKVKRVLVAACQDMENQRRDAKIAADNEKLAHCFEELT